MSAAERTPPTPVDYIVAPELAALTIVDHAIDVAILGLIAAHPSLVDEAAPYWVRDGDSRPIRLGRALRSRAAKLQRQLRQYRDAVLAEAEDLYDQDLPF